MSKNGFLKVKIHSIEGLSSLDPECIVKMIAGDVSIASTNSLIDKNKHRAFYLPISDKIQLQLHGGSQNIGYFDLPIKKIYDYPLKRHLITVSCITKDTIENSFNPQIFGVVKLSLKYFLNHIVKFTIIIGRVLMAEEKHELVERELFVQCKIGTHFSQTTAQKMKEELAYEWNEQLSFTLQSIPSEIELQIKDKDIVDDEIMGRVTIDPQRQEFFSPQNNQQQRRFEIKDDKRKIVLYLSKIFEIPSNQ